VPSVASPDELAVPEIVVQFGRPPNRVDLLSSLGSVSFATAWRRRVKDVLRLGTSKVALPIIALPDLLQSKRDAGRHKDDELRRAQRRQRNLRWLDAEAVSIEGVRFLGAPLWFERTPIGDAVRGAMHDFSAIRDLEDWVYRENARARAFFEAELRAEDVVVTHHLPCAASVAPRWRGSPLNAFFLCDLEALIRSRAPALWIHGHTHESVDVLVGTTRVVCNPFGYARREENPRFDPSKDVTVP
jgi:hypothetical protein